jgi:hypothetical protein
VNALLDETCVVLLTHLSGMAARCSPDLTVRRTIDQVVFSDQTRDIRSLQRDGPRGRRTALEQQV